MKIKEFIEQTLHNRALMLCVGFGPYTSDKRHRCSHDYERLLKIWNKRHEKWKLQSINCLVRYSNAHYNICPRYLFQDCETTAGQVLVMSADLTNAVAVSLAERQTDRTALEGRKFTALTSGVIPGFWFLHTEPNQIQALIQGGRHRKMELLSVCEYYLHEWNDGTFRDVMPPRTGGGGAADIDGVGEYHRQERPWAHINFKDLLVYGVELETLAPDPDKRYEYANVARKLGLLAERDGSLAQLGLEIIGMPMTFDKCVDPKGPWKQWIDKAKKAGFTSWYALNTEGDPGGYGMHINLNRHHFNTLHLEKLIAFINNEIELSRQIAGRSSRQYALLAPKVLGHGFLENEKYQALALRGRNRAEIRIFRGTMRWEGFLRNIEFADAAIEFTRQCANDCITTTHFLKWLDSHNEKYPNLMAFLPLKLKDRYKLEI